MNPHPFENALLRAEFSTSGALSSLTDVAGHAAHSITADEFEVVTDAGTVSNRTVAPVGSCGGEGWRRYAFRSAFGDVALEYRIQPGQPWLKRRLVLSNLRQRVLVERVVLGRTVFSRPPREFVNYETFWNAPTVCFLRFDGSGLFSGIENPFFAAEHEKGSLALSFEPALILEPGQTYESEAQFLGVCTRTGQTLTDHLPYSVHGRRPRFRNPCGHIPIDLGEVRAMQDFARDYLDLKPEAFRFVLYNFFYPLPQMPRAGSPEEAVHLKMIDTFKELGGDLIIFNPMHPYARPSGGPDGYWDLGPEGSGARRIMDHAERLGIRFGFYMGCARHGEHGNAAALPYAPEATGWKKVDAAGKTATENCMACDAYADWFFTVQRNTIDRFKLGLWSWDPGPGNGLFCHSDQHGHLPGKGAYKGWRNATSILRRLKESFPGIYFQAYYGRKEYGLWGFKYFDQYESYWEWGPYTNATTHPDVHADRLNADGTRFQSWWNQNFRFHPSQLNHCMVHRFQEGWWDPRLVKAWDQLGWKYSVMSCLACGGDLTTVILPESTELVPGFRDFYRKWLEWARRTAEYRAWNIPFGDQVRPGGVDGWARIRNGRGFIFLCNPGPRAARIEFKADSTLGFDESAGPFTLRELYPVEGRRHFDLEHERGIFRARDGVAAIVPAHEVALFELEPFSEESLPLVFGVGGSAQRSGAEVRVSAAAGEPGEVAEIAVTGGAALSVNGRAVALRPCGAYARAGIEFSGPPMPRLLDDWRTAEGAPFAFPYHAGGEQFSLRTAFRADPRIRELLSAARPRNLAEYEPLLAEWRKNFADTFVGMRPDRLWLVIPLVQPSAAGSVRLSVNGGAVPVEAYAPQRPSIHYADLTDHVRWGEEVTLELTFEHLPAKQFLGPYLEYPPAARVEKWAPAASGHPRREVVYAQPVDSDMPVRAVPGSAGPVVTSLAMEPGYLHEGQETVFTATVDRSASELEAVYISGPWHDAAMAHDAGRGCWSYRFTPGARWGLIMDVPAYRAWAVTREGLVGPARELRLEWRF